jgi:hypothetical protein
MAPAFAKSALDPVFQTSAQPDAIGQQLYAFLGSGFGQALVAIPHDLVPERTHPEDPGKDQHCEARCQCGERWRTQERTQSLQGLLSVPGTRCIAYGDCCDSEEGPKPGAMADGIEQTVQFSDQQTGEKPGGEKLEAAFSICSRCGPEHHGAQREHEFLGDLGKRNLEDFSVKHRDVQPHHGKRQAGNRTFGQGEQKRVFQIGAGVHVKLQSGMVAVSRAYKRLARQK